MAASIEEDEIDFIADFFAVGPTPPNPNTTCDTDKSELKGCPSSSSSDSKSAIMPRHPMFDDGLQFLNMHMPPGPGVITYNLENGSPGAIHGLHPEVIALRGPLISCAMEPDSNGTRHVHLDVVSSDTANLLVRYLYTGSYAVTPFEEGDRFEDVPSSLLLHCKMYRLGDLYDMSGLKTQARVNAIRQCEFGCLSSERPIDLCKAIELCYEHLATHEDLLNHIICYCVARFLQHELAKDVEFCSLAYRVRRFHQDLCRESMNRNFEESETAAAIIQLPFEHFKPPTYASRENIHKTAIQAHLFAKSADLEHDTKKGDRPYESRVIEDEAEWEMVLRPPPVVILDSDDEQISVACDDLGHRNEQTALPIRVRNRNPVETVVFSGGFDSDSESDCTEWEDVFMN